MPISRTSTLVLRRALLGRMARIATLTGMVIAGLGQGVCALGADVPLFTIEPNPPQEGKDVVVSYSGEDPEEIVFQIGAGDERRANPDPNGRFRIPGNLLDAELSLTITDKSTGESVTVGVWPKQ